MPEDLLGHPVSKPSAPGLADTEVLDETGEMRITLSGAMRARDVSRPSDEQLAAEAKREEAADRAGGASRPAVSRPGGFARADAPDPIAAAATVAPAATAHPADDGPATAPPRRRRRRRS